MLCNSKERPTLSPSADFDNFSKFQAKKIIDQDRKFQPLDSVAKDICALYPRRQGSIWKRPGQKRWMQWSGYLTDNQVLGVMSDEGRGLLRGCYWGEFTRHGVLDIDQGSKYQTSQALDKLTKEFAAVGLKLLPFRSSESGGWHLYFYFGKDILSHEVESSIKKLLKSLGYEILSGTLEIFPSGNALRLPLQKGFAWLGPDGQVTKKREELTESEAIASFLSDLENQKSNWSEAKNLIHRQVQATRSTASRGAQDRQDRLSTAGFDEFFWKGIDWEKYERGRQYWTVGLTGKRQRHDAVVCIGHYLWYGDQAAGLNPLRGKRNAARRARLIEQWLERSHNGFSRAVNLNNLSDIRGDIERATSWTSQTPVTYKREAYPLTERALKRLKALYKTTGKVWTPKELEAANIQRCLEARDRIALAVAELVAEGHPITKAEVARRAGASRNTVQRHADLLTNCSSVINSGGFGGFSENASVFGPILETGSSVLSGSVDCSPGLDVGLDSLRSGFRWSDGEQLNGIETEGLSAALSFEPSYGVKPWSSQSLLEDYSERSLERQSNGIAEYSMVELSEALRLKVLRSEKALCYSFGTAYGTRQSYSAMAGRSSLSFIRDVDLKIEMVSDAINRNILTILENSSSTQFNHEFSLIYFSEFCKTKNSSQSRAPPGQPGHIESCLTNYWIKLLWLRYRDALKSRLLPVLKAGDASC